jgi:adenylate cyclase
VSRSSYASGALDALLRWLPAAGLALLLVAHGGGWLVLAPVRELDAGWHDARLRAFAPDRPNDRVAVVDIDERSLAELGRWPWGRDQLARLIERLFERERVALVGLDLILAEPERPTALAAVQRLADGPLRDNQAFQELWAQQRDALDPDRQLEAALRRYPVVLGFHLNPGPDAGRSGQLPPPLLPVGAMEGLARFDGYGANLPRLAKASRGAGFLDTWVDADGLRRRAPLLVEVAGQVHGSLALATCLASLGPAAVPSVLGSPNERRLQWRAGERVLEVRVGDGGDIVLPYAALSGQATRVSALDVMQDRVPAGSLEGRIVLIGASAAGLGDRHATPVSQHLPGVQGHAALLSALLDGRVPHRPPWTAQAQVATLMVLLLVLAPLLWRLAPTPAGLATLILALGLAAMNAAAWVLRDWALPLAAPVLLCAGLFAWRVFYGHVRERSARHRLEALFGQYVPPELVKRMSQDPQHYDMQGRNAELTVLFADLRGFTRLSETMPASELAQLMNDFLSEMTDIVREYGGTLDKYIGDSVMAFWGAPVADPQHARHALEAAQAMLARLPALNARFVARGWPALSLGIGINSGTMVVGDLGSRHRRAYTVLGDAVNVAARLQGLTARLGADILLGEGTQARLPPGSTRHLAIEHLRGRQSPVAVYVPADPAAGGAQKS